MSQLVIWRRERICVKTRVCYTCKVEKLLTKDNFYKNKQKPSGLGYQCKDCVKAYDDSRKEQKKLYHENHKELAKILARLTKYGITDSQYKWLLSKQNYKCACCGTNNPGQRTWHIDHDHSCCPDRKSCSKCIRGLICSRCNLMLGHAHDDVKVLQDGINYLNNFKKEKIWERN